MGKNVNINLDVLTGYNGCDMYLMNEEKEVGIVQAISWKKEKDNLLRGEMIIASLEEVFNSFNIFVNMNTETSPIKLLFTNVRITFNKDKNTGVTLPFEADSITEIK